MNNTIIEEFSNTTDAFGDTVAPKPNDPNYFDIFFDKFKQNSSLREIVEPPQIEGSTVDDWLHFFMQNAFIFIIWILAMIWVVYVIFYHSRVMGYILTKFVNYLFMKNGYFKIGSFSFASISGKVMFRDVVYVNEDYTLRIQDGWIVFCYWIPYIYRNAKTEDLSNSEDRVIMFLNGLELHIYNRSSLYSELEKIFKLPSKLFGEELEQEKQDDFKHRTDEERRQKIKSTINKSAAVKELKQSIWRDLIPKTKIEIACGRFVFGNHIIPSTLSVSFEDANFHYTSRPATSQYDLFTHILKGKTDNLQVVIVPSENYNRNDVQDEPPRIMGDGFNVFRTNKIDIYYYQDSPGYGIIQGEDDNNHKPPAWGVVIKTGKGTDFSYGPWADRQRDSLYSFFFPSNYQIIPVNEKPLGVELRQIESFDLLFSTMHDAKIDILFTKNKETKALHINAGPGTYLEMSIPWICNTNGYTSHIQGQIMRLEATTSLQFRPLLSCETLQVDLKIDYPRYWNEFQEWNCKITACKATIDLIFAHKIFITELIDDWSEKSRSDIFKFIPYTWKIALVIKEFELLVFANEHNWIDCSTTGFNDENSKLAVCGEHLELSFDLPFIEYLPPKLVIKIWIQGECLEGAFYLPDSTSNCDIIELLQRYSILMSQDGTKKEYLESFGKSRKWKNIISRENNWFECMSSPLLALSITYDFWPIPILSTDNVIHADVDCLQNSNEILQDQKEETFDPNTLDADVMTLELEIGSLNIAVFGSLFMLLWNIKENYMGEAQAFNEMCSKFFDDKFNQLLNRKEQRKSITDISESLKQDKTNFDSRLYRPFEVVVSVSLHSIQGHLVQCTNINEQYSPLIYIERLCFELKKGFSETLLQLIISPAVLQVNDCISRIDSHSDALKEGFLTLSSLQFRGHAMFSNLDRPIESETLEYAWLVEVEVGEITGRLTIDQLVQILIPLENFYYELLQCDIWLQAPVPFKKCLHDRFQNECTYSDTANNRLCPYSEDLKYKLVRVIINEIDVYIIESNVILNVNIPNLKLGTCNLHINNVFDGFSLLINNIVLRQFVSVSSTFTGKTEDNWIEISSINFGPFFIDSAISSSFVDSFSISQIDFIKAHDSKTKRLWFLWNNVNTCGCVGNCTFFGCNISGIDFFSLEKRSDNEKIIRKSNKCFGRSLHDHDDSFNPVYGESLLHPESFLLDIHSTLLDQIRMQSSIISSQSNSSDKVRIKNDLLKAPTWKSKDIDKSLQDISTVQTQSQFEMSASSSSIGWASPQGVLSADDITLNYQSANEALTSTSQPYLSAHASNSTLRKITNLSSDSTPTLVSVDNDNDADDDDNKNKNKNKNKNSNSNNNNNNNNNNKNDNKGDDGNKDNEIFEFITDSEHNKMLDKQRKEQPNKLNAATRNSLYFDTTSNTSFISAASDLEDLNFVDLRPQLEKPIYESPLLMASYSSYMSHYQSKNFNAPPPFPQFQNEKIVKYFKIKSPQAIYFERLLFEYRNNWKTKFVLKKSGFTQTKIVSKSIADIDCDFFYKTNFVPGIITKKFSIQKATESSSSNDNEAFVLKQRKPTVLFNVENRSKTKTDVEVEISKGRTETQSDLSSVISSNLIREDEQLIENIYFHIQFMEINIKVSPLSVDLFSKFITSAEKVFTNLHPASLLQHMSLACQLSVQNKNALKREKLLYLGQLHLRSWKVLKNRQYMKNLNRSISFSERASKMVTDLNANQNSVQTLLSNHLNSDRKLSLNLSLDIQRINIDSIQASLVEEVIKFSYLDRIKDQTCVSLLNISFENIALNFKRKYRMHKVLNIFMCQSSDRSMTFAEKALMTRFFTRKAKKTSNDIETFAHEFSDAHIDEKNSIFDIGHVHLQLSRLVNSVDVLSKASFTVIPYNKTKVDFLALGPSKANAHFRTERSLNFENRLSITSTTSKKSLHRQKCLDYNAQEQQQIDDSLKLNDFEHFNRFIMFEAGFEKLNIHFFNNSMMNAHKLNYDSTISNIKTNETQEISDFSNVRDCDSLILKGEISKIWLHFASPSKIMNAFDEHNEFSRHDWHLLSSAVPLAIAWISAIDRMSYAFSDFTSNTRHRCLSTLTCLISNSLNTFVHQDELQIVKPLYSNSKQLVRMLSVMARAFQEDPSIQMINMLRKTLKNDFSSNDEFENQFHDRSVVPTADILEKGIVVLLLKWKDLMFGTDKNLDSQQTKTLFTNTKNQILSLFDEKTTKQLNTPAKNLESSTKNTNKSEPTTRTSKFDPVPEISIMMHDGDNEGSNVSGTGKEDLENLLDVSSSITKLTLSDIEATKRNRASSLRRGHNRIHFVSKSHLNQIRDSFYSFPIIRNLSAFCSILCNPVRNSMNRIRNRRKETNDEQELHILHDSEIKNQEIDLKGSSSLKIIPEIVENKIDHIKIDLEDIEKDEGGGRQSSYSHYGDKRDLYWWMAKVQQDYRTGSRSLNVINNISKEYSPEMNENQKEYETIELEDMSTVKESENRTDSHSQQLSTDRPKRSQEFLNDFSAILSCMSLVPEFCEQKTALKLFVSCKVMLFCVDIDETEIEIDKNMYNVDKLDLQELMINRLIVDEKESAFVFRNLFTEAILGMNVNDKIANDDFHYSYPSDIGRNLRPNLSSGYKNIENDTNILNMNSLFIVIFDVELEQVIQRINLPLLRLVHQFSAMYENVVQTRFEMQTNRSSFPRNDLDSQAVKEKTSLKSFSSLSSLSSNSSSTFTQQSHDYGNNHDDDDDGVDVNVDDDDCNDNVDNDNGNGNGNGNNNNDDNNHFINHSYNNQNIKNDSSVIIQMPEYFESIEEFEEDFQQNTNITSNNKKAIECWKIVYFLLEQFQNDCNFLYCQYLSHLGDMTKNQDTITSDFRQIDNENCEYFSSNIMNSLFGVPIVITGKGKVKQLNLVAMLSNLKLDGDLTNFRFTIGHQSLCRKETSTTKSDNIHSGQFLLLKNTNHSNLDINLDQTKISLFEDLPIVMEQQSGSTIKQQLVVQMLIGKSSFSLINVDCLERKINCSIDELNQLDLRHVYGLEQHRNLWINRENNAKIQIGTIDIDIPQHPIALHSVMTRSGKHLTSTLQQLRTSRQPSRLSRQQNFMSASNTGNTINESNLGQFYSIASSLHDLQDAQSSIFHSVPVTPKVIVQKKNIQQKDLSYSTQQNKKQAKVRAQFKQSRQKSQIIAKESQKSTGNCLTLIIVKFNFTLKSFTIKASLLPSLRAQYQIGQIESSGITGPKAKFHVYVNYHSLCFNTLIDTKNTADLNLPTEASIFLPGIQVQAEYTEDSSRSSSDPASQPFGSDPFTRDIVLREGGYLKLVADIGDFRHCLTTDLLNHLLFVQKVFMKEVNEVLQKMAKNEKSNFMIFSDRAAKSSCYNNSSTATLQKDSLPKSRALLFSLQLKMTGIQITATTPTNSAVRFETGPISVQLSNRVVDLSKNESNLKFFVRVHLDFNLALGQLIRNYIFEEAEPDFQQLAYFRTRINMRNGLQEDRQSSCEDVHEIDDEDKEMLSIILSRPLVYVQPMALDKAVLVWINYKNAYEYWNEQRANLNKEVIQATQQVFDKVQPIAQSLSSSQSLGTLLLQLNVNDFGVCLPLSSQVITFADQTRMFETDLKDALVLTLESTRISACLRGSLVSKAQFKNLCIRFADDFETNLDDWKPKLSDFSIKNLCIVSEGTYEICSRTITFQGQQHREEDVIADAKWILNVSWKMDGFDIHVDTSIGKHISALVKTMTAIAGDEDEDEEEDEEENGGEEEDEDDDHHDGNDNADYNNDKDNVSDDGKEEEKKDKEQDEEIKMMFDSKEEVFSTDSIQKSQLFNTSRSIDDSSLSIFSEESFSNRLDQEDSRSIIFPKSSSITLKELNKQRARNLEKELNEQVKIINDLRQLGASSHTIQQEVQKFHELEAATFNHFKRGVIKKFKRPSESGTKTEKSRTYSTTFQYFPQKSETIEKFQKINEETNEKFNRHRSLTVSTLRQNNDTLSMSSEITSKSPVPSNSSQNAQQTFHQPGSLIQSKFPSSTSSFDQQTIKPATTTHGMPIQNYEPKIDFELDVKILFSSGKCVLHTRDQPPKTEDSKASETTQTGNSMSPLSVQKALLNKSRSGTKLSKLSYVNAGRRDYFQPAGINPDFTVFLIPGLDIKLHYNSKCINSHSSDDPEKEGKEALSNFQNLNKDKRNAQASSKEIQNSSNSLNRQKSSKKALLFAWITLSSIPDEIFISPHILDFFEEALKPIPITVSGPNSANATLSSMQSREQTLFVPTNSAKLSDRRDDSEDDHTPQYVYYGSFPVDVVVFFHFQPTIIRLGCLPVSRVECLIHLPSIDLVMSSKKSDGILELPQPHEGSSSLLNKAIKNMNKTMSSDSSSGNIIAGGGLSITGCLADFSLYIFHPYGGHKNKSTLGGDRKAAYSNAERKDSLSLQVEFIKINISRSRKVDLIEALNQSISFSAVCDIGTATFKYDVRRLNEILAFPKAWYRKSIWKKIFIGENTVNAIFSDDEDFDSSLNDREKLFYSDTSSTSSSTCSSDILQHIERPKKKISKQCKDRNDKPKSHMITIVNNPWNTLILLTVNFSNFNISMNMGNVMGNTTWLTRNLMCDGSIYIDSQGHRKFRFGLGLNKSTLDAKGGIVGGSVELSDIRSEINIFEDPNHAPQHQITISLHTIESRVDYMTTSILMARISDLSASFNDEWNMIDDTQLNLSGPNVQTRRPDSIHMHGCLKWDQFQVLMSKSTSPDFIKILLNLKNFFINNFIVVNVSLILYTLQAKHQQSFKVILFVQNQIENHRVLIHR